VSTLFPAIAGLILKQDGAALLRARVPPETWTTRRRLSGRRLRDELLDHYFRRVTFFSNECSK
jgi:hypothetical protein